MELFCNMMNDPKIYRTKDISKLRQKAEVTGDEKIPVSKDAYISVGQIMKEAEDIVEAEQIRASEQEAAIRQELTAGDVITLTTAKEHTDTREEAIRKDMTIGSADALAQAKAFTTEREGVLRKEQQDGDTVTLQSANKHADEGIAAHNTSETAHEDIRTLLDKCVGLPEYDPAAYKLTFTTHNGQKVEVDFPIEKMDLHYNAETGSIEWDNGDGSVSSVPVSEFVKEYVGSNGAEIVVTIGANNTIQASIVGNSIAWEKLSLALQNKIEAKADEAYVNKEFVKGASIVATAIALAAGQMPSVSWDPATNRFTFGIPKGDTGEQGPQGPKGDPGTTNPADINMTDWVKMLNSAFSQVSAGDSLLVALQKIHLLTGNGEGAIFQARGTGNSYVGIAFEYMNGTTQAIRGIFMDTITATIGYFANGSGVGTTNLQSFIKLSDVDKISFMKSNGYKSANIDSYQNVPGFSELPVNSRLKFVDNKSSMRGVLQMLTASVCQGRLRIVVGNPSAGASGKPEIAFIVNNVQGTNAEIQGTNGLQIFHLTTNFIRVIPSSDIAMAWPTLQTLSDEDLIKKLHSTSDGGWGNLGTKLPYDIQLGTNIVNGSHEDWVASYTGGAGYEDGTSLRIDHTLIRGKQITYRAELKGENAQASNLGFEIRVHFTDNTDQWIAKYSPEEIPERGTFETTYTFSANVLDKEVEYAKMYPMFRSASGDGVSGKLYIRHEFVGVGNTLPSTWSPSVADLKTVTPITISDFKNLPSVVTSAADGAIIPVIAPVSASNGPAGLSSAGPAYGYVQVAKAGSVKAYNFLVQMDGSGLPQMYSGLVHTVANTIHWSSLGGGGGGTEFPEINYDQLGTPLSGAKLASVIASGAILLTGDFGTGVNATLLAPKLAAQAPTESCFIGFFTLTGTVIGLRYAVNNTTGEQSTEFLSFVSNSDSGGQGSGLKLLLPGKYPIDPSSMPEYVLAGVQPGDMLMVAVEYEESGSSGTQLYEKVMRYVDVVSSPGSSVLYLNGKEGLQNALIMQTVEETPSSVRVIFASTPDAASHFMIHAIYKLPKA